MGIAKVTNAPLLPSTIDCLKELLELMLADIRFFMVVTTYISRLIISVLFS